MIKTKSHFQSFIVSGGRPKNATGAPIVVRAPQHLRCFRATIIISNFGSTGNGLDQGLFISTFPTNEESQCVYLSTVNQITVDVIVGPVTQLGNSSSQQLILDRRGVGYMDDEFYLYSDEAYVTIIWEGEVYE
jgi:hypothetical protein